MTAKDPAIWTTIGGERLALRPSFTLAPPVDLYDELQARRDTRTLARAVQLCLYRFFRLLAAERASLDLSVEEAVYCWAALRNEDFTDYRNVGSLPQRFLGNTGILEAEDKQAIESLFIKLHGLRSGQRLALADAIERARSETYPHPEHDPITRLRTVGLLEED